MDNLVYFYDQREYEKSPLAISARHVVSHTAVDDARAIMFTTAHGERLLCYHDENAYREAVAMVKEMMQ